MADQTLSAGTVSLSVHPDTSKFSTLLKGALKGESGNWQQLGADLGKKLTEGAVAGVGALAVASTKMAMDFQDSTTQLVTGAGESESALAGVRKGILDMASSVGSAPQELSKGLYMIESAGYHGAKGLDVLKAAAMGAKVGGADMETVANALTTAMTDYNIPANRANAVTSALVATVAAGKMHMEDLGNALGMVMPKASALGVSFQDVNGALATMTATGMSARRASMNLSNTILSLGAPSKKSADALTQIGLTAQQVKDDLGTKGLAATMDLIEKHVSDTFPKGSVEAVTALKNIMGGTVGYGTALALTGTHMATFVANVKSVGTALNGQNTSVQGAAEVQKDLKFQIDSAKASVQAIGIQIGMKLIPIISDLLGWLANHKAIVIALAAVIGGVMLVAMGMWVSSLFAVGGALAFVMSPITLVVLAVAALVAGVIYAYNHFTIFKRIVDDVWNWLKDAVLGTINFIKGHWDLLIGIFTGPFGFIIAELAKHWRAIYDGAKRIIGDVIGFFTNMPSDIIKALGDIGSLLLQAGKDLIGGLVKGIESVVTAPLDAVKKVGSGILNGVKSFFGIHSPSTVMAEVGGNLMQGLANGITNNTDGVSSAAMGAQDALLKQSHVTASTLSTVLTPVIESLTAALTSLVNALKQVVGINTASFSSLTAPATKTSTKPRTVTTKRVAAANTQRDNLISDFTNTGSTPSAFDTAIKSATQTAPVATINSDDMANLARIIADSMANSVANTARRHNVSDRQGAML